MLVLWLGLVLSLDGLVFVLCSCLDMVCHCAPCGLLNRPMTFERRALNNLSELHTSVTALRTRVCMLV